MSDIKQLKIKIQSTKNIKKITNAMEIISTIKLQKIKKNAEYLREYMITFLEMLASIDSYTSLFPSTKEDINAKELVILVSSEKWLCGSLNTMLFKQFAKSYDHCKSDIEVFAIGKKARDYCVKKWYVIVGSIFLKDVFDIDDLKDLFRFIDTVWKETRYTSMKVRYNYFKNTMKQIPVGFQLFPLSKLAFEDFLKTLDITVSKKSSSRKITSNYMKLEPSRKIIVERAYQIIMNVIIYGAVLHNKTGEFASRMLAMKGAKDNASTIIMDLTLAYNKARQDAITKEVLEIVSAKAVIED